MERIASLSTETQICITIIEIRPFRNGWKCFEVPGVEPVFACSGRVTSSEKSIAVLPFDLETGEIVSEQREREKGKSFLLQGQVPEE